MKKLPFYNILFIALFLCSCGGESKNTTKEEQNLSVIETGVNTYAAMTDSLRLDSLTKVKIETNVGELVVALFDETPLHKENFLKLTRSNFYNNTLFHRVIKQFMAQGGDPNSKNAKPGQALGEGGPGYTIPKEFNNELYHIKGALAAARRSDQINPLKESSGSQFYIVTGSKIQNDFWKNMAMQNSYEVFFTNPKNNEYNLRAETYRQNQDQAGLQVLADEVESLTASIKDSLMNAMTPEYKNMYTTHGGTPALDGKYTVFGYLVSGYETLAAIENNPTAPGDRPIEDIKIIKCSILND
ncbi:peptidylprolyl isomerase [Bacteroidia bacterium]|nr:peptidylprolyl isomerase [Bacteroidia bacterium]